MYLDLTIGANLPRKKPTSHENPSHREELTRLKRIRGQIDGIERMINDNRYCMDIVTQIRSITAALRSTEGLIMERHIRHCVTDAISSRDERVSEQKISELLEVFQKR
jgi:CsoR family transcriptional regulator, copper-sensing transcriptional repressor